MRDEQGSTIEDGRRIGLEYFSSQRARIWLSAMPPLHNIGLIDNSWDYYTDLSQARIAYQTWKPEMQPEPDLWSRNVLTGRYRILGLPNLEYVKCDDRVSFEDQIKTVIQVVAKEERAVVDIRDETDWLGPSYPETTKHFMVVSLKVDCTHAPRCRYYESVYHYLDRYVVITPRMYMDKDLTVGNVVRRLTDQS